MQVGQPTLSFSNTKIYFFLFCWPVFSLLFHFHFLSSLSFTLCFKYLVAARHVTANARHNYSLLLIYIYIFITYIRLTVFLPLLLTINQRLILILAVVQSSRSWLLWVPYWQVICLLGRKTLTLGPFVYLHCSMVHSTHTAFFLETPIQKYSLYPVNQFKYTYRI